MTNISGNDLTCSAIKIISRETQPRTTCVHTPKAKPTTRLKRKSAPSLADSDRCPQSQTLKSESDRWTDGAIANNFNRQRRDRSRKNSQLSGHARKTVLADVSQKKSGAATWNMRQTRHTDMLAYGCAQTRVSHSTHVTFISLEVCAMRVMPRITFSIMTTISSFVVETRRTVFSSGWTFLVFLAYCRSADLSLYTRLLDRFLLPFPFYAVSCSNEHRSPFEQEPFGIRSVDRRGNRQQLQSTTTRSLLQEQCATT